MMDIFAEFINVDDLKEKGSNAAEVAAALHLKKSALLTEQARFEAIVKDETLKSDEKEKAEKRLLSLAGEISVTEGKLKALETHLREVEVKQSVQLEAMKGAEKLAADISAKEAKVKDIARVISEKKALYNEKFKAKKNQQVAAQDLVRKATDLKGKAEEESIKAASLNCMREQIKGYDDKLLVHTAGIMAPEVERLYPHPIQFHARSLSGDPAFPTPFYLYQTWTHQPRPVLLSL